MKFRIYIVFVLLACYCFASCPKARFCAAEPDSGRYIFEIPLTIQPVKESYRVGDTLHVSSVFPDSLRERQTDRYYSVPENTVFFPIGAVVKIDTDTFFHQNIRVDSFVQVIIPNQDIFMQRVVPSGSYGSSLLYGEYVFEDGAFRYSFSMILKEPGVYVFELRSGLGDEQTTGDQTFPGMCPGSGMEAYFHLNEGRTDTKELLNLSGMERYRDNAYQFPELYFHPYGSYVFVVEE